MESPGDETPGEGRGEMLNPMCNGILDRNDPSSLGGK